MTAAPALSFANASALPEMKPRPALTPFLRALERLRPSDLETGQGVLAAARQIVGDFSSGFPRPGGGRTALRHDVFSEVAAVDLSLARIVEGHADALAILMEAGREPESRALYGVWAADGPSATIRAERTARGWLLRGRRKFASGAFGLDRALVTAHAEDGLRLFDVPLPVDGLKARAGTWQAIGMAATESVDVVLEDVSLPATSAVGEPGFYLARPGFWFGAIGVAACWFGGAVGALRSVRKYVGAGAPNEHQKAHLGAMFALCAGMRAAILEASDAIDAHGGREDMQTRALVVRQIVESGCQEVLARAGRAGGTSPLVFDRAHARRAADLVVYLRQHHAERDLASLGERVLAGTP